MATPVPHPMRAAFPRRTTASGGRARWAAVAVLLTLAALPASTQPFASGEADAFGLSPEAFSFTPDSTAQDSVTLSADRIGVWGLRPVSRPALTAPPAPEADSVWTALLKEDEPLSPEDTVENVRKRSLDLTVFGYYRFFGYGRNITEPYPNLAPFERTYGVGDGYREPILSVTLAGRPNGRSAFGTELFIFNPYDGSEDFSANTISLNLGVNFYGNFRTEAGNYGVRAGGIHWYNLSPFTIGVNQVLDRYSVFERTPWEGVDGTQKYENYFLTGQANPGDERFDFQAFQGLILNGAQLPGDFAFDAFWGKTQPNGGLPGAVTDPNANVEGQGDVPDYSGFAGESRVLPSFITGGRIQRSFGSNTVALNSIYSYRTLDSLNTDQRRQYQVHTTNFDANLGPVNVSGELGASLFESPTFDSKWGEALMLRARTPEALTVLPLDVQVYQIGRNFFNENSEISTTNNPQLRTDPRCEVVAGSGAAGGGITQVGFLEHNRRGVNVNTEWGAGPAQFKVGWGLAHELAPTTTTLTYVHRINGLAVSRIYNPFPANAVCATRFGPQARKYSVFRGAIERAQLTDVEPVTGLALNRKYYHAVDIQGKLRGELLDRSLYLFYLGSFGSANQTVRALPTDDNDYIFAQYHEFDAYVELTRGFLLAGYLGIENVRGGQFTELDPTSGAPRDQRGLGLGLGFDWTLASNAGLYLRHRWMDFEDKNFALDAYEGTETTLELKIFF